jgi:acyl-coenzyme A thioesterase PaaI-like protein
VLDEVMVWACAVQTRRFTYCAELGIRYVQRAIPNTELIASGELESNQRDKIYVTKAELHDGTGALLASATGKYLPARRMRPAEMVSDFVGDAGWLLENEPR